MKKVLVVAPHADDETLGCGGTLLKHYDEGDEIYWLIVTSMSLESGFSESQVQHRQLEIEKVNDLYGFKGLYQLGFPPASLDTIAKKDIVNEMSIIIQELCPEVVYCTYRNDVHSDHEVVFDTLMASTKSFRCQNVKRILAYETLSETDFSLRVDRAPFRPNVYVNIDGYLDRKIEIMSQFASEISEFPFPRSGQALKALAQYRGVQAGCNAAEAFMLLKEIV